MSEPPASHALDSHETLPFGDALHAMYLLAVTAAVEQRVGSDLTRQQLRLAMQSANQVVTAYEHLIAIVDAPEKLTAAEHVIAFQQNIERQRSILAQLLPPEVRR